jgi:hypothetical protein
MPWFTEPLPVAPIPAPTEPPPGVVVVVAPPEAPTEPPDPVVEAPPPTDAPPLVPALVPPLLPPPALWAIAVPAISMVAAAIEMSFFMSSSFSVW